MDIVEQSKPPPARAPGKPSPYAPKMQAEDPGARKSYLGIGGPAKRCESLSGIGNNLRSHKHAGLGRSVGKAAQDQEQSPSGLSKLLRRAGGRSFTAQPTHAPTTGPPSPFPAVIIATECTGTVRRRGSNSTAAATIADSSASTAGPTVFPTNSACTASSPPKLGHRNSITVRYSNEKAPTQAPSALAPASPPVIQPVLTRSGSLPSSPQTVRIVRKSVSGAHTLTSARNPTSPRSSVSIGSPTTNTIVDVVGSPRRPSIIYMPIDKLSGIGGVDAGKAKMNDKASGIGGHTGKDWMADRPSGMGSPVPQNSLPPSGLGRAIKSLAIGRKDKVPK
ncbi:hypothetical protein GGI12_001664 [Dipsacomyces acuminosporus]|nr:hypothetical protein GGI12_001664 [Dipsacomyces acuminosporus]